MVEIYGVIVQLSVRSGALVVHAPSHSHKLYKSGQTAVAHQLLDNDQRGHAYYAPFREAKKGMLSKDVVAVFPELPVGNYVVEHSFGSSSPSYSKRITVYPDRIAAVEF